MLIVAVLILSTNAALANTEKSKENQNNPNDGPVPIVKKTIVWDNGAPSYYTWGKSASWLVPDPWWPINTQTADDFKFDEQTTINIFHWWGGYFDGRPVTDPMDFNIYIYEDDGTTSNPTGSGMLDPETTAIASYYCSDVSGSLHPNCWDSVYEFEVVLNPPFKAEAGKKYWIVPQAYVIEPGYDEFDWYSNGEEGYTYHLNQAVWGCSDSLQGVDFWTGTTMDMGFYLAYSPIALPRIGEISAIE